MKNNLIYIGIATLIGLSACSGEHVDEPVRGDSKIKFKPILTDIAWSRALDITGDNLYSFQATCFNPAKSKDGPLQPYFSDISFGKISSDFFVTVEEGCEWPDQKEFIDFIAFSPSRGSLATAAGISLDEDNTHFVLVNNSTVSNGKADYDYSLTNIVLANDISQQYDFLRGIGSGSMFTTINDPVTINFNHALSRIVLHAYGSHPLYRVEIAGVRLGGMPVEGSYDLSPGTTSASRWTIAPDGRRDKVEYIFGPGVNGPDDRIIVIDKNAEDPFTVDNPALLMGNGGAAMMIPCSENAWDYKTHAKTTGSYVSVLMRVSNLNDSTQVAYPYSDKKQPMTKIWLAVNEDYYVTDRLYPGEDGRFYTDPDLTTRYRGDAATIKAFGWAAIPVNIDWMEGQNYVYTIDYTRGLGVKDPDDTHPGELILNQPDVNMALTVTEWISNKPIDTSVPRK